ncbi:MAG: isoleucine--tRNA ligase [Candidatus Thermoplasmatota archaeon]
MKRYYREPAGETFPQLEEEVLALWREEGTLSRVKERMRGGAPLVFCEGPPTANRPPDMSDALTRAVKDSFLRYHIMNGRDVLPFIAGWDCHGLPVEIEVERALGIDGKGAVEAFGVGGFNDACRESVVRYKADWEDMSRRLGYGIDYEHAYLTMSNEYIESVWWSFKQLHSRGLVSKSLQVAPYCPRCGTPLSTHEVALGFEEAEVRWAVVRFRVPSLGASALVYTETPWTLVANALLAVDASKAYGVYEVAGERAIVAEDKAHMLGPEARPVRTMAGSELVGMAYEPPFAYCDFGGRGHRVVGSHEVTKAEGTGVMHVSPPYASVDRQIGEDEGVAPFDPVDDSGRFTAEVPDLAGRSVGDASPEVVRMLEAKGLLFKWGLTRRSSPFCWRCRSPLMYKPRDVWSVRASGAKERMAELNSEISWVPTDYGGGRFGTFLEDAKDWVVSRSRYWGTPLPVWRCPSGHEVCVGSVEELARLSEAPLPEPLDLHRPSVDSVRLRCPECGAGMAREQDVLDCWYDSGCAPFAQYHYPFENIAEFETHRSVDFITESSDQTRGWFYTQHVVGTLLFDAPAFRSVLVLERLLDEKGRAMGAGAAGAASPAEVFGSVGADAARLYLLGSTVSSPVRFSMEDVRKTMVGTLTTVLNLYAFYSSNANAYGYTGQGAKDRTHDLDRWILSRLNSTIGDVRAAFDAMDVQSAVRATTLFVDDLSGWYVRRSRRRFWMENDPEDRFSAHATLHECLASLSLIMAPAAPFFSDWLYRCLKGPKGCVHLEDFPRADASMVVPPLESQMAAVRQAVEAGRTARQGANVKLRQPLDHAVIASSRDVAWVLRRYERMIAEELNVKRVECVESREGMVEFAVSPNLRTLGPKFKESASEVSRLLDQVDGSELVRHLRASGKVRLGGFDLTEEDVLVSERQKGGYAHASAGDIHAYMSLAVDRRLRLEGLSREVIRRVQHMRKEQGLEFEDEVVVEYSAHPDIEAAISSHMEHIRHETHARALTRSEPAEGAVKWTVDRMPLELVVRKA